MVYKPFDKKLYAENDHKSRIIAIDFMEKV
jgi:hypothetical protein